MHLVQRRRKVIQTRCKMAVRRGPDPGGEGVEKGHAARTAGRSSAMVAAIGDGDTFAKGRDFAAWLGLVPKQISTGDRTILGKISKRGNRYLRVLFVQAAWVVLIKPKSWDATGSSPGSRQPRSGCTTTCSPSHSPTSWRASPGAFSLVVGTSRRGRSRQPPNEHAMM